MLRTWTNVLIYSHSLMFKNNTNSNILLAAMKFCQVRVQIHHCSCDVIPVHSSQVVWQSEHGGQSLLTQFSIVPGAQSVSDKVRGSVCVRSRRDTGLALQQEFMHLTQFQLPLRWGNWSLVKGKKMIYQTETGFEWLIKLCAFNQTKSHTMFTCTLILQCLPLFWKRQYSN